MTESAPRIPERDELLEAADKLRPVLEANAEESERIRRLPDASADAIEEAGLFRMITPRELGGCEADPLTQHEVIERVAYADPSAAWCTFIGAGSQAFAGAMVTDRARDELLEAHGGRWPRFAGTPAPAGTATRVEGGYRVTGRWGWASGIHNSDCVFAGFTVPAAEAPAAEASDALVMLAGVFPKSELTLEDTWDTAGLRGTGSTHFRVDDAFLPEHRTFSFPFAEPQRGGAVFRLPVLGFFGPAFSGFPQGVARRALDEITELARTKMRLMAGTPLAERGVFQRDLAVADARLRAAGLLVREALTNLWEGLHSGRASNVLDASRLLLAFTHNAETAADVVDVAYKYGGGDAVFATSALQRCKRDMHTATAHMVVGEHNYEYAGKALLGTAELNPALAPRS